MTLWWLSNISRANYEREKVADLYEKSDWLKNLAVSLGDGNIAVEFDIVFGSSDFELIMTYPVVFPDAPPQIKTRSGVRISDHQYGASGELCLEYRPDNWRSEITGAMMIESAFTLLSGENPQEGMETPEIVDGHMASIGQATRSAFGRFVFTQKDMIALEALKDNRVYSGILAETMQNKKISARIKYIGTKDNPVWLSQSKFTKSLVETEVFYISNPVSPLSITPSNEDILNCIDATNSDDFDRTLVEDNKSFYLLIHCERNTTLYWVSFKSDNNCVFAYQTLNEPADGQRILEEYKPLREAKVGLVGCGSLGSKVAMQLVRSEINSLILIDDDILFENNLVRHELSIPDIGFHKTLALRNRLHSVNPELSVTTRQIKLGGQESSESIVSAMKQLSECDLIIDATANPEAFNIIASVCRRNEIPVVWGSIFAGGIGGMIGRARPGCDPEPLDAKQQIFRWCETQDVDFRENKEQDAPYEMLSEDGVPIIATDSDVSVMASHVAQFAIDTLCKPENSDYPYSAYVTGLSNDWIFSAPFDTRPIIYNGHKQWSSDVEKPNEEDFKKFLKDLLPSETDSES